MNCPEVQNLLSPFIDGELETTEMAAMKAHFIRCPDCRKQRDQLSSIGSTLRSLPPITTPPDFEFQLFAKIRSQPSRSGHEKTFTWTRTFIPIAAMAVGIFIGSNLLKPNLNSVDTAVVEQPKSEAPIVAVAPVMFSDEEGIKEYTMDSYMPNTLVPMTVDYIPPDDPNDPEYQNYQQAKRNAQQTQANYVLDRVYTRASYDRTIY